MGYDSNQCVMLEISELEELIDKKFKKEHTINEQINE